MESLKLLVTLLPLSLSAGINLYATVLTLGLSIRFHWIEGIPEPLLIFGNWWIIGVAGFFFVCEFVVDKFNFFDTIWDVIHTFIRPIGAAILGFTVLGQVDPILSVIGGLICGGIAFSSHSTKAGSRVLVNTSPEMFSNIIISLCEDIFTVTLTFLTLKHPYWGCFISLVIFIFIIIFFPRLIGWCFFQLKAIITRLLSFFISHKDYDSIPLDYMMHVNHQQVERVLFCKCCGLEGVNSRAGYLAIYENELIFIYKKWFKIKKWSKPLEDISNFYFRRKILIDMLAIPYKNKKEKWKTAKFLFLKTRSIPADKFYRQLLPFVTSEADNS